MKSFVKIKEYGQLFIDRIIFETFYPIIFTCKNNKNDYFICVCYQNNSEGCNWLVGKTTPKHIIELLENEITVREILTENSTDKYSVCMKNQKYDVKKEKDEWEDESCLPKVDSYLDPDEGEFDEEIKYYQDIGLDLDYPNTFSNFIEAYNLYNNFIGHTFKYKFYEYSVPNELQFSTGDIEVFKYYNKIGLPLAKMNKQFEMPYNRIVENKEYFKTTFSFEEQRDSTELEYSVSKCVDAS